MGLELPHRKRRRRWDRLGDMLPKTASSAPRAMGLGEYAAGRRTSLLQTVLTFALMCVLPGCQSEPKPIATKSATLTSPYRDLDYYVSCLWPDEKAKFFASLREKGFQKTVANLDVPMSFWYATVRGGGRSVTPHGYLSWDEYGQYRQRLSDVTRSLRASAATVQWPDSAQRLGKPPTGDRSDDPKKDEPERP
jgi:hypothetical protein